MVVLSSAKLAISVSSITKNKSIKKILNNRGPRIDPCGNPNVISSKLLYDEFNFVRCFLFDK